MPQPARFGERPHRLGGLFALDGLRNARRMGMSRMLRQRVDAPLVPLSSKRLAPKDNGARARRGERPGLVENHGVHPRQDSMTEGFLRKTFRRARMRWAVPRVKGAASASAHGQATINTDTNEPSARVRIPPRPEKRRAHRHRQDHFREAPAVAIGQRVKRAFFSLDKVSWFQSDVR